MDPLNTPAHVWIKTRKHQKHRMQYWALAWNTCGKDNQISTDTRDQYGVDLGAFGNPGWYTDGFLEETLTGSVTRIRGARFTLYVPVTSHSDWHGTTHYLADAIRVPRGSPEEDHEDAIKAAARMADECARIEAEHAVEGWEEDEAAQRVEEARARIHEINMETLPLIGAIKAAAGTLAAPICEALRGRLAALLANRADQFRIIEE